MRNASGFEGIMNILHPRLPYMGGPDLITLQRHRNLCWLVSIVSLVTWVGLYFLTKCVLAPHKMIVLGFIAIVLFTLASRALVMGIFYFGDLKKAFSEICLKDLVNRLSKVDGEEGYLDVRMKTFLFHSDFEQLRDSLRAYLLTLIKEARAEKRRAMSAAEQARLKNAHDRLDAEILALAHKSGIERKIEKQLKRRLSLSHKRSLLLDLARFAVLGSGSLVENRDDTKLQKLVDYLIEISDGSLSEEAHRLHLLAKRSPDIKTKERHLQEAIEAQRRSNRETIVPEVSPAEPKETRIVDHVDQLPLWTYARRGFVITELLPSDVDEMMATTILLLLIGPGDKSRRFQAKYWREGTLRREVIHHYERILKSSYQPSLFAKTIKWLRSEGILFTKAKSDEMMYALSAKPGRGASSNSQEIIKRVVNATEAFKSGRPKP